jgi:hypothetical protein
MTYWCLELPNVHSRIFRCYFAGCYAGTYLINVLASIFCSSPGLLCSVNPLLQFSLCCLFFYSGMFRCYFAFYNAFHHMFKIYILFDCLHCIQKSITLWNFVYLSCLYENYYIGIIKTAQVNVQPPSWEVWATMMQVVLFSYVFFLVWCLVEQCADVASIVLWILILI